MSKKLACRVATAHWLYRLTFNAAVEAERSFGAYRRRQVSLGNTPTRPSAFDQTRMLTSLRVDDDSGPAFAEASDFSVVMLRAAAREAHDAVTNCIAKWSKGERASMPRFRSVADPQTVKLSAFSRSYRSEFGARRPVVTFAVKGLGRLKARLSRPLPPGHQPVELHLTRQEGGKLDFRVVS